MTALDVLLDRIAALDAKVDRLLVAIEDLDLPAAAAAPADERHAELIAALFGVCREDLAFDCGEVLDHAASDHRLRTALDALGIVDTRALGTLFRSLRDRPIGGIVLCRDGRDWRMSRM